MYKIILTRLLLIIVTILVVCATVIKCGTAAEGKQISTQVEESEESHIVSQTQSTTTTELETTTTKTATSMMTTTTKPTTQTTTSAKQTTKNTTKAITTTKTVVSSTSKATGKVNSEMLYTPSYFKRAGVIRWNGFRWTYYSQKILPGYGLKIPGRHVDSNGYVCDENGYICLASNDLRKGTIVPTPFGKQGKIYDCGCASGTLDVYVNW